MKYSIRYAAATLALLSAAAIPASPGTAQQAAQADLILRGGTVYPGGAAPFTGDVAIRGDRITYVGPKAPGGAARIIDATGLIVAPGFIDPHTHVNDALTSTDPASRLVLPFLTQGVTTAFIGVDGGGDPDVAHIFGLTKLEAGKGELEGFGQSSRDYGINFATYVGLGTVRMKVIGPDDRAPTPAELDKMVGLVDQAMCDGALGFSTGLFYAPQSFAKRDEVVALARAAAVKGGVYDSHIRDESSYTIGLKGAIDEALAVGRDAKIPVHIAHIKALGVDVHGEAPQIIAEIEAAQKAGQVVHADQYPWSASGTGLSAALLPRWAQDGGRPEMLKRFADAATMAKMRPEIADNLRRRGGPASLLITSGAPDVEGKTLEEVAKERKVDPVDAAIAILTQRETGVASFNQTEPDIAAFMKQPWVVTSSDASRGHPRYYASFARKYATYVKDKQVINLQDFIDRSTSVTAQLFGLDGRGTLKAGAFADIVAFDPATFAPRADFTHPTLFSTGMRFVVVNGQLAIENGEPTGIASGRPLPHRPAPGTCPSS
ncbi:N-acyl-D-amino-acid deacylase family protein [Sphingopyxis panaciterrulae]|uniref:N-acyl-D-aspartate/D-glutamate deacylase n=1 Tax=Sphingopyxis panaciterrulae TaxID=462372 RepID=A0A7W9ERU2_9SPHN|nr:amidohydrolase family protein [Sphingopyxis panaciterrulae]MBB5708058.1 N-acyl-D-aspartate/D-glutamate deacylase [Sphingopyxis panaciterrulae]